MISKFISIRLRCKTLVMIHPAWNKCGNLGLELCSVLSLYQDYWSLRVGYPSSQITVMAYFSKSCAPNHRRWLLTCALGTWGVALKPLAAGLFPMIPEICRSFGTTGFIKLFWVFTYYGFSDSMSTTIKLISHYYLDISLFCATHRL